MPTAFLTGIHLRGTLDISEAGRRLATGLDALRAHGLEPYPFAADAWHTGNEDVFGGTSLVHEEFSARTGKPIWGAGFSVVTAPHADATVITMQTPGAPLGTAVDVWHWLTPLAEDLCDAIAADFAMANGFTIKQRGTAGGTPAGPEVAPGKPPRVLAPWMYWSPARVADDALADGLRSLATVAFRSSPSRRGGWVLQPYENYTPTPPQDLIAAYSAILAVPPPRWIGVK